MPKLITRTVIHDINLVVSRQGVMNLFYIELSDEIWPR